MKTSSQQGIGIVEVIVALLLLSIGVLGFAMLQIRAMDASMDASKRIQAMNLARDLSERMRANKQGLSKSIAVKEGETEKLVDAYVNALSGKYLQYSDFLWYLPVHRGWFYVRLLPDNHDLLVYLPRLLPPPKLKRL